MRLTICSDKNNDISIIEKALIEYNIDISKIKSVNVDMDLNPNLCLDFSKKHNIKINKFKTDWKDLSVKNCSIKENKYGKYNSLAAMNKDTSIVEETDICVALSLNDDNGSNISYFSKIKKANKPVYIYNGTKAQIDAHEEGQYSF
jgi:hypothetical protein